MVRYEISTKTAVRVPRAKSLYDVAPAVTSDGTVYFWRSKAGCGSSVRLVRWTPAAGAATVLALPKGIDAGKTFVLRGSDGRARIYYERYVCTATGEGTADIYKIVDMTDPAHP
jgi:hypothetical protein